MRNDEVTNLSFDEACTQLTKSYLDHTLKLYKKSVEEFGTESLVMGISQEKPVYYEGFIDGHKYAHWQVSDEAKGMLKKELKKLGYNVSFCHTNGGAISCMYISRKNILSHFIGAHVFMSRMTPFLMVMGFFFMWMNSPITFHGQVDAEAMWALLLGSLVIWRYAGVLFYSCQDIRKEIRQDKKEYLKYPSKRVILPSPYFP